AVDPQQQGAGYGRELMAHAEQVLRAAGCPKINLQVRTENVQALAFYERLGFTRDAVVSYGKRLIAAGDGSAAASWGTFVDPLSTPRSRYHQRISARKTWRISSVKLLCVSLHEVELRHHS